MGVSASFHRRQELSQESENKVAILVREVVYYGREDLESVGRIMSHAVHDEESRNFLKQYLFVSAHEAFFVFGKGHNKLGESLLIRLDDCYRGLVLREVVDQLGKSLNKESYSDLRVDGTDCLELTLEIFKALNQSFLFLASVASLVLVMTRAQLLCSSISVLKIST